MLLWGVGVWDLNDDDDDDGTISSKDRKAAAMIYHPLNISDESNIVHKYILKFIEHVIAELRPSPEWTVDGCILSGPAGKPDSTFYCLSCLKFSSKLQIFVQLYQ